MSHSHADRVAKRPGHMCAAYGCSMLGTMATSTAGTSEWWCFAHFGKDVGRYQRITAELRRVEWLSKATSDVRTRHQHEHYAAAFARIEHDFALAQRSDLLWTSPESEEQWLLRLERELATILAEPAPPKQQALAIEQPKNAMGRVAITLPNRGESVTKANAPTEA